MNAITVKELKQLLDNFEPELEVFLLSSGGLMPVEFTEKEGNIIIVKSNENNY